MQGVGEAAAGDGVLMEGQSQVPAVGILPEAIGFRDGLQDCGEIEGAAAAVEIVGEIIIGVLELEISRF